MAGLEVIVAEVEGVLDVGLRHLSETVEVELPDEGFELGMTIVVRQNFLDEPLGASHDDLFVAPADDFGVLGVLRLANNVYLHDFVELENEVAHFGFLEHARRVF